MAAVGKWVCSHILYLPHSWRTRVLVGSGDQEWFPQCPSPFYLGWGLQWPSWVLGPSLGKGYGSAPSETRLPLQRTLGPSGSA